MRLLRDNGLTIALLAAFLASAAGMLFSGWKAHNEELAEHGAAALSLLAYFVSGDFVSALFENWESEFLQVAVYVVLTAYLFQRGSAESLDPDAPERDDSPANWLYAHSLGLALACLFVLSAALHLWGSMRAAGEQAALHGQPAPTLAEQFADARFWFESLQNWQSEFFSTAALVVLSIFLRYRGSPESKRVDAKHDETGK